MLLGEEISLMPIPRKKDQLDRLVLKSLKSQVGRHWNDSRKFIDVENNRVVFHLRLANSVKVLEQYRIRYENVTFRITGEVWSIDWIYK